MEESPEDSVDHIRRTGRSRRQTARAAACDPDEIGGSVDTGHVSARSSQGTPKSLKDKNREAQQRFRVRQKVTKEMQFLKRTPPNFITHSQNPVHVFCIVFLTYIRVHVNLCLPCMDLTIITIRINWKTKK